MFGVYSSRATATLLSLICLLAAFGLIVDPMACTALMWSASIGLAACYNRHATRRRRRRPRHEQGLVSRHARRPWLRYQSRTWQKRLRRRRRLQKSRRPSRSEIVTQLCRDGIEPNPGPTRSTRLVNAIRGSQSKTNFLAVGPVDMLAESADQGSSPSVQYRIFGNVAVGRQQGQQPNEKTVTFCTIFNEDGQVICQPQELVFTRGDSNSSFSSFSELTGHLRLLSVRPVTTPSPSVVTFAIGRERPRQKQKDDEAQPQENEENDEEKKPPTHIYVGQVLSAEKLAELAEEQGGSKKHMKSKLTSLAVDFYARRELPLEGSESATQQEGWYSSCYNGSPLVWRYFAQLTRSAKLSGNPFEMADGRQNMVLSLWFAMEREDPCCPASSATRRS